MTTDVHAHCVPAGFLDALRREGDRYGVEVLDADAGSTVRVAGRVDLGPLRADFTDVAARLAAMDRAGVRTQLLSSWVDLTAYALPAAAGVRYARLFNELLVETVAAYPDRFRALCTVPLQSPAEAAKELRHAVESLGAVGVEIATTVDGRELDDEALDPFWAAAADLGCLVLVHPYDALAGRGVSRYFLGNLVGNPAETTVAVAHLVFGGVLERFPELRVCVVHGGGFLPYQRGRLDRGYAAAAGRTATHLSRPPGEWLRRLYYDTVVHSPEVLAALIDFAGADHVVLGSDYPFEMGDPQPVTTVSAVPGLSDADRDLILRGNVDRLLGHLVTADG